jgi:hypothetical protein
VSSFVLETMLVGYKNVNKQLQKKMHFTISGFHAIEETEEKFGKHNLVTSFLLLRSIMDTTPESDAAAKMCATLGFHAKSELFENISDFFTFINDALQILSRSQRAI